MSIVRSELFAELYEVMKNMKIKLGAGRIVTLDELFKAKKQFHRELSRLPFEDKIKILMNMRRIVEMKKMA